MLRKDIFLTGTLFLLLPLSAWAMQSTVWDFTGKQVPGDWSVTGWTAVTPTDQGVRIQADGDGFMQRLSNLQHSVDAMRIIVTTQTGTQIVLLWHRRSSPEGEMVQLPVQVEAGKERVITENMLRYPEWDPRADRLGFALPKGADVTIAGITLIRWTPAEKLAAAWRSFWTFDTFNGTTINFLWGPILSFSPADGSVFATQPPRGRSANWLFYTLLAVAGAVTVLRWAGQRKEGKQAGMRAIHFFLSCALSLWIFYDARMGAEFIVNAVTDVRAHTLAPAGQKRYRSFENFYDATEQSLPLLRAQGSYVAVLPGGTPLLGRLQYFAYPSLPARAAAYATTKVWFVYRRPDISVQGGVLQGKDGTVLAKGGTVVKRFDDSSFLYAIP